MQLFTVAIFAALSSAAAVEYAEVPEEVVVTYADLTLTSNNAGECEACKDQAGDIELSAVTQCLEKVPETCVYSVKAKSSAEATTVCDSALGFTFNDLRTGFPSAQFGPASGSVAITLDPASNGCTYTYLLSSDDACSAPPSGAELSTQTATESGLKLTLSGDLQLSFSMNEGEPPAKATCGKIQTVKFESVEVALQGLKGTQATVPEGGMTYSGLTLTSENAAECEACKEVPGDIELSAVNECLAQVPKSCIYSLKVKSSTDATTGCTSALGFTFDDLRHDFDSAQFGPATGSVEITLGAASNDCEYKYAITDENACNGPTGETLTATATEGKLTLKVTGEQTLLSGVAINEGTGATCSNEIKTIKYNAFDVELQGIAGTKGEGETPTEGESVPEGALNSMSLVALPLGVLLAVAH